jgi:hypothetical protein
MNELTIETDGDTHEVVAIISGKRVVFACLDESHAAELKDAMERCAWFQIESTGVGP